jgi:CRISPR/Cas system-associated exonuclease Cas4 (RecB family)
MRVNHRLKIDSIGTINIKGSIDRVDEKDSQIRIIDYKTGGVSDKLLSDRASGEDVLIENLFKEQKDGSCVKNSVSFQLMLYKMLYVQQCGCDGDNITPAVFSLRDLYKDNPIRSQQGLTKDIMKEFEEKVREKITEIFDDTTDFKAVAFGDGEFGTCRYCNFRNICKIL